MLCIPFEAIVYLGELDNPIILLVQNELNNAFKPLIREHLVEGASHFNRALQVREL